MTVELIQGSDEWLAARCGSLGASQVHDALAKTKSGWGASRGNLLWQLTVERLTGKPTETFVNAAMMHGTLTEPEARDAYAFFKDADVTEVGLVLHPRIQRTHASPDGLVGDDGLLEIKCMQSKGHGELLKSEKIPARYLTQMNWQLSCTGRQWVDFVAYQPSFPESMRLFVRRIERDDKAITELETEVEKFLAEVEANIESLTRKYEEAA